MRFLTVPIDQGIADEVRRSRADPIYGDDHPARVHDEPGYGPCRVCLRRFRPGERALLFLFNPFGPEHGDYAGPIFIHEQPCDPFAGNGFPSDLRDVPLRLRSYDAGGHLVAETRPTADSIEEDVERLLSCARAATVHARNDEAKCFIAHIVPARRQ